jgi:hypothetical protein
MSMNRKFKRSKLATVKKEAKSKSEKISQSISSMPKNCDECGKVFDKTDAEMINTWRIAVYDDGRVHLVCGDCSSLEPKEDKNDTYAET